MKLWKKGVAALLSAVLGITSLGFSGWQTAKAEVYEGEGYQLSYEIVDSSVTITGFDGAVTEVEIPAEIDGLPVTTIGEYAFYYPYNLTSVTIPDSVTTIGKYAFSGCENLTTITIPDSVTTIGDWAFEYCESLTAITIPDSVIWIGHDTFYRCENLTSINVEDENTEYSSLDGVLFNRDQTKLIIYPCGRTGSYEIPNSVTTIGDNAFAHCENLTALTIPDSVTWIDSTAFFRCINLISINVEEENTEYSSLDGVLFNRDQTDLIACPCGRTGSYEIPNSVTTITMDAFYGCDSLTTITIPDSVLWIGGFAFADCDNLTTATIPDGVTAIENYTFYHCGNLTTITIPDSVTTIGSYAFMRTYLAAVTIPDNVTTIGEAAFCDCDNLTTITIPDSVTAIGDDAFYDCDHLTDVYYSGTQEQWTKLGVDAGSATVHCVDGTAVPIATPTQTVPVATPPTAQSTTTTATENPPIDDIIYGDVNTDGRVELVDAILLSKYCAGTVTLTEQAQANADCNGSGNADTSDAVVLLRFLVHLVDALPDLSA